jgi:RNA polymerase sigma-32 factor
MSALNDREKRILTQRRLIDEPETLEELSQSYGISRERVRQIEVRAFEKLSKAMHTLAVERKLVPALT